MNGGQKIHFNNVNFGKLKKNPLAYNIHSLTQFGLFKTEKIRGGFFGVHKTASLSYEDAHLL